MRQPLRRLGDHPAGQQDQKGSPANPSALSVKAGNPTVAPLGTRTARTCWPACSPTSLLARALSGVTLASRLVHDLLASMLAVPPPAARTPKWHLAALVPAAHDVTAIATFLFAVLVAGAAR